MTSKYAMDSQAHGDLAYVLKILEEMEEVDAMNECGARSSEHVEANPKPSGVVGDIEAALLCALEACIQGGDGRLLRRYLKVIAEHAAALPEEELRPFLRCTSPVIDAMIPFCGLWQSPNPGMIVEEADASSSRSFEDDSVQDGLRVPFLAFLLAMTDFPFTGEELEEIRSGWGASVAVIRREIRGETRDEPEKVCAADESPAVLSAKRGGE